MKKNIFLIQVIFIGCFSTPTEQDLLNKSNPNGIYGEKITQTEKQKINTLILNDEKFLHPFAMNVKRILLLMEKS